MADVSRDDLAPHFRGADVVVHLAWLIQPSRDPVTMRATNVEGSDRGFRAVADAGVGALDESWPTEGIATSSYSMHKVAVERLLDRFEREHPAVRVVGFGPA